jgi:small subunit ribosomal protein S7
MRLNKTKTMRKSKPKKRPILPDPRFSDTLVTKFVNNVMMAGKKNIAYEVFYEAIDTVSEKTKEDGLEVFKKALANVTPSVEQLSRFPPKSVLVVKVPSA